MKNQNRNFGLDLARAIAISMVLISHLSHQKLDSLGFFGVELFFALSGYLIGNVLWRGFSSSEYNPKMIANFWARRWWRTLPNYYFFLIIMVLLSLFFSDIFGELPDWNELLKYLFFSQSLFQHTFGFYSVAWSLCIEEFFYLLFPLILFVNYKLIGNKNSSFLLSIFIIVLGCTLFKYNIPSIDRGSLREITFARLDAIAFGVFIAYINVNSVFVKKYIFTAIAALFIFSPLIYVFFSNDSLIDSIHLPQFLTLVPLGFAFLLPSLEMIREPKSIFIKTTVLKLSQWSFSLYLSHSIFLWFVYDVFESLRSNTLFNLISKVIVLILSLFFSALIYKYFEIPMMNKRPKELKN
jgi:peptidoglycan/LPS O-acetylase OafA/YrhL